MFSKKWLLAACVLLSLDVWAFCKEDVNAVVLYEIQQQGQTLWRSDALMAYREAGHLCLVKSKEETAPLKSEVVTVEAEHFWVSIPGAFEDEKPKKAKDDWFKVSELTLEFSKFKRLDAQLNSDKEPASKCAARQQITLSADKHKLESCYAVLSGIQLQVSLIDLDEEQQEVVKEKKGFWDLDSADEKAEKRMKKF